MWWWLPVALGQHALDGSAPPCDTSTLSFGEREQYLVSSAPGEQAFSYIGHVGLWIRDGQRNIDHIIEFGAINSQRQEPLTALLLGDLQCSWRVRPFQKEFDYYARADRLAVAQRIELPPEMEWAFVTQIYDAAAQAGDETFLFHWRKRSCASELRDILDRATDNQLSAQLPGMAPLSARGEVLRHLARVPWAWFGWSLFAGAQVDQPISVWDSLFVPRRLVLAANDWTVRWPNGDERPLIAETCTIFDGQDNWPASSPPDHTLRLWLAGLLLGGGVAGLGKRHRRVVGAGVAVFGLLSGLLGTAGLVLFGLSTLDAYGPNRNWLFINPLNFALVGLGISWMRRRSPWWGWPVSAALAALAALGLPLWLVPLWPQADHLGFLGLMLPGLVAVAWLSRRPINPVP